MTGTGTADQTPVWSRERGFVALVVAVEQQHVEVVAVFPYDICVVLQVF